MLRDEPLAPLTSFHIGGPAELLLLPAEVEDVRRGIAFAEDNRLPWRVIGSGTNILIPDAGLPGLTIKFWRRFSSIGVEGTRLRAQAGATAWEAAKAAAKAGLAGLEFACGIPGTVGGAVCMNAGVKELEIKDILVEATVLEPWGRLRRRDPVSLGLAYRTSTLQRDGGVVLDALFQLQPGGEEEINAAMNRFLAERRQRQPINQPTCGSVFRNPAGDFAGRLIDASGCKGLRGGSAEVSELHANFIVNLGGASSGDVISLITEVRRRVEERFGVRLELELRILE